MIIKDYTSLLDDCMSDNITDQTLRQLIHKTIECIGSDSFIMAKQEATHPNNTNTNLTVTL